MSGVVGVGEVRIAGDVGPSQGIRQPGSLGEGAVKHTTQEGALSKGGRRRKSTVKKSRDKM